MKRLITQFVAAGLILSAVVARAHSGGTAYRSLGYLYLSPMPGAQYCSPQTCFVLVRFATVPPTAVTNLAQFIQVNGASSGPHFGTTKIASDNRTVIFYMLSSFIPNEVVTVSLTPQVDLTTNTAIPAYQYQFMVSGAFPPPGTITARGDNPPNATMAMAFDNTPNTEWQDLIVPNGPTNFSWIQYVYPGTAMHVVNSYSITSANDNPAGDPSNWQLYGVDLNTNLILLDTRSNQRFSNRLQTQTYTIPNTSAYRGYRLQVTRVNNPATATSVQLAELAFNNATGSVLWEYWLNISGTAVADLTNNANFPNNPSGSALLPSFVGPVNWADNYGTRVRGFITAPLTGTYGFWIASDDNSALWLSTDANPTNATLIASVPGWTNPEIWNVYSSQQSAPVNLVAGQRYYIEALQKEGGGGDSLAVGWAMPGQAATAPSEVIPGEVLSPWTSGTSAISAAFTLPSRLATARFQAGSNQLSSVTTTTKTISRATNSSQQSSVPALTSQAKAAGTPAAQPLATSLGIPPGVVPGQDGIMPNGVSVPTDFPYINITTSNNPDSEYILIDNRGGNGDPWNVIFDNSGQPVWYSKYPDERRDMKVQHNGVMTMLARDEGDNHFNGFNTNYQKIAEYWTVNGYSGDEHELQVLADGTYFLIGLQTETVDMSQYIAGGSTASVTEDAIQEFTAAGDLIFQWRAWDHLNIVDQQAFIDLTSSGFDFPHMNSIDVDTDGNILLSSRNTSECTKIDRNTGDIIWRLGGVESSLTFPNDPLNGPANQHAWRMVGTNDYTLFDDGNLHNPSVSRGVEYVVDTNSMTATLVWQYPPTPTTSIYAYYMGNVQRLTNGNTLIDWAVGNLPKLTEVRPDGTKAFEMNWVNQYEAYRTWRCSWSGIALQPYLLLESYPDNVTLIFNQFGDTNVAYYRIYGGPTSQSTNFLATSTTTLARLTYLQNSVTYYFRVTAVHRDGTEGQFSNEQSVTVNLVQPGQNMVANANFSLGTNGWTLLLANSGSASWAAANQVANITIANGGTYATDIQLQQAGFRLIQGFQYVLSFDAWASRPRYIQAEVGQAASPYLNYSSLAATALTPVHSHFQYAFTMTRASDFSANLMFNLGTSTAGVMLSNISLSIAPPTTATLLKWVQPPTNAVAGNPLAPEIQVGAYNVTYPVAGLPITLFITNGIGVLAGIQSTNTDTNGIAHFPNLSVSQAGLKQLAASNSSLVITSAVFTIMAPPVRATALSWVQQPSSAAAGSIIAPEIQVMAWTNATRVANILLTLSLTNGAGSLAGIQATNTDANGIAHFPNLSINRAGLKQLAVGDATTRLVTNSASFTISAAAANKLVIGQPPPANATAGVVMTPAPVVQITDLYGNVISNATDSISAVQTSGTGGNLKATTAAQTVAASNGTAVFSGLFVTNASANVSLTFNDASLPNPTAISSTINVSPNTATQMSMSQQPSSTATAGTPFAQQPGVTIGDAYGNTVVSYTNSVRAAEASGGSLNASLVTPTAAPLNGVASFTGLFVTNAAPAVTLNFTSGTLPPVNSTAINVGAGQASQLIWTTQPGNAISGRPFDIQPALQTADPFANPSTSGLSATQNVQVLLSAGTGPLQGTTSFNLGTAGSNGVVAFNNLRLDVPGTGYVLTATNSTANPPVPPQQSQLGLWLDASALSTLTLSGSNVTAWNDRSGHGRNASGGISPAFATNSTLATGASGLGRIVRFNGSSTYLVVDLSFLNQSPYTIAVVEVASNKGSSASYFMGDTGSGGNSPDNALHTGYRSSGDFTFAHYGDDLDYVPGSFTYPAVRVWMDMIDAGKNKAICLNGVVVATGTASGLLNTAGSQGHLGSGFDTSSTCFQGDIAEILVYTNAQTANAASITSYLSNKWLCASCAQPALASAVSAPFTVHAAPPPSQQILGATVAGGGSVVLTYATTPGFQYHILFSTNLASGLWRNLPASVTNATAGAAVFTDTNTAGDAQRFYRIVSP